MTRTATPDENAAADTAKPDSQERLQKLLAAAGLGSRRQCEELILTGRVEVDHKVVTELGSKADPRKQEIRVDGVPLPRTKLAYYAVNKPVGVVTTNRDPSGRPRVIDLLPRSERLFPVGRLDMASEGLILLTNDGELANRLAHPRYGVQKTYHVEVAGMLEQEDLAQLKKGVYLAEGFAKVVGARIKSQMKKSTLLEMVLDEGRNREIRRLLARIGHKVLRLKRVALGPLRMGDVPAGAYRQLTHEEVRALWQATTPEGQRERNRAKPGHKPGRGKKPYGKAGAKPTARPAMTPRKPTVIGGDAPAPSRPSDKKPAGARRTPTQGKSTQGRSTLSKSTQGKSMQGKSGQGKPLPRKAGTSKRPARGPAANDQGRRS